MKTKILKISNNNKDLFQESINHLINSDVIAFPTETVYGIGCNIFDMQAVSKIFEIKKRSRSNPLAAHIGKLSDVDKLADFIPDDFYKLSERFLPGPLSIILKKKKNIGDIVTAGFDTIGIRFPGDPVALELINCFGEPLAATSANISGNKSPISAGEVFIELKGLIPLIIDGGITRYHSESTVISLATGEPVIFRSGIIDIAEIEEVLSQKIINYDKFVKSK